MTDNRGADELRVTTSPSPPSKGRILVVDDDRLVLATLAHGLAQAGYEVLDADNGDDAILLARERRPQLALLDIRMEGKSGFDVAEFLRQKLHVPFMFLSAFSDEATLARVKELGAIAYLVKPLDIRQIVPAVEAAFAQGRQARAGDARAVPALAPVPLAVGLLMQRHGLDRGAALQRLERLAGEQGGDLEAQALRLVEALETLMRAGG